MSTPTFIPENATVVLPGFSALVDSFETTEEAVAALCSSYDDEQTLAIEVVSA